MGKFELRDFKMQFMVEVRSYVQSLGLRIYRLERHFLGFMIAF